MGLSEPSALEPSEALAESQSLPTLLPRSWIASGGNYFRLSFSANGATSLAPWLGASGRLLSMGFGWS